MSVLKCIGCYELCRKETREMTPGEVPRPLLITYDCVRFPYACALAGLLRPTKGITLVAENCPRRIDEHCILCSEKPVTTYGDPALVYVCKVHDEAWKKWLENHPERRDSLAPKGRLNRTSWVEVFREFIEDMRKKKEG
jgi:hypothetical protein